MRDSDGPEIRRPTPVVGFTPLKQLPAALVAIEYLSGQAIRVTREKQDQLPQFIWRRCCQRAFRDVAILAAARLRG